MTVQVTSAQSKKEKDRASFISNTKLLEKKPFDENAGAARNWGFKYVADTDEVSVVLCSGTMKLIPEKKNKFKSELLMQFTFGMAVFKLENPDQKDDETAAQVAGLESMLRTYEVMLAENEKAKSPGMDDLLIKRNGGELKGLVESGDCKEK
ncbi:MAG: hypothetical protein R2681_11735 [Pyrinomonadaceae bacterium]